MFRRVFFLWSLIGLLATVIFSGCDSGPQIQWDKFDEPALEKALDSGRPTLAYFYAAWCRPCQKLRSTTFRDARVVEALKGWNLLKADMSFRENKITIERTQAFQVWGLPMLIFYSADGKVHQRTQGYLSAEQLLEIAKL